MMGFENVLVRHNDCDDHGPQLLWLLERHGMLAQKAHRPDPARPPQPQAHGVARRHPLTQAAEWAFVCDIDEFLVIHRGDGTIGALLDEGRLPFAGIAINWRIFGTSGRERYEHGLVPRQFRQASRPRSGPAPPVLRRPGRCDLRAARR